MSPQQFLQPNSLDVGDKVYVHDDHHVWVPAIILESEPDRVLVQISLPTNWKETTLVDPTTTLWNNHHAEEEPVEHAARRWIQLDDYKDRQLPLQNETVACDMANLRHLHEAAVLYQIKHRHLTHKPYTRVGDIVVAMNPCHWSIPHLYSAQEQHFYAKHFIWNDEVMAFGHDDTVAEDKKDDASMTHSRSSSSSSLYDRLGFEPHIYEVSALAYRGMFLHHQNQTILVSGESGAGKTETVKIVLEHLATLESSALLVLAKDSHESILQTNDLVQKIVTSSPIFEAFGNAHTMRNHNSSRFGKMTRLHFASLDNGMWGLCGSTCQTYLLETNRVVSQADEERNFHVFYQLLAASSDVKEAILGPEWRDATAHDFKYLNSSENKEGETSDKEEWSKTCSALELFGLQGSSLVELTEVLGVILRLGNIVFSSHQDESGGCKASTYDLLLAAQLLDIEPDVFEHAMTTRVVKTARDCLEVPLTAEAAKDSLDALVKRIYAFLFAWVVSAVNSQTLGEKGDGIVSLLDIYGFERFDINRFEQLCINYANEKLHKKYVDDNFARFQIEYQSEGLEIFDFAKIDNDPVLQLFDGPKGLIGSISEECLRPQGNSTNFVRRIKQFHADNDRFVNDKLGGQCQFGVVHFAGSVIYDADHFVERNTDSLPSILVSTMTKAKNRIIRGAFKEIADETTARRGSPKKTILDKFRVELKDLIASIDKTQSRYIRCIKPNESLSVGKIDQSTVMRQLKCAGLVAAIDLSRESFPSKLPFAQAEERFQCLLDTATKQMLQDLPPYDRVQLMMSTLFAPVLEVYSNCDFTLPFACGTTRVYFRAGALELLESERRAYFSARALILQRWIRCKMAKHAYYRTRKAIILVQSCARSYMLRLKFLRVIAKVCLIQNMYRSHSAQLTYLRLRKATITMQTVVRGHQCWQRMLHRRNMAKVLCTALRMFCTKQNFRRIKRSAVKIQTQWRAHLDRQERRRKMIAILTIQSACRLFLELRHAKSQAAAITIQSAWRSHLNVLDVKRNLAVLRIHASWRRYQHLKLRAVQCIQSSWRSYQNTYKTKRLLAAILIQSSWRGHRTRNQTKMEVAAGTIQMAWKMHSSVKQFRHIAVLNIQSAWRKHRNFQYRQQDSAALCIQSAWFNFMLRKSEEHHMGKALSSNVETRDHQHREEAWDSRSSTSTLHTSHRRQDSFVLNLHRELGAKDVEIHQLRYDVAAIAAEAETGKQELEAEYEERLVAYEEEVLHLREMLDQYESEKTGFVTKEEEMKKDHEKNVGRLKSLLEKTQASHKEYLLNVTSVLDKATEARRVETEKILDEVARIKNEKNAKIASLTRELNAMKEMFRKRNQFDVGMETSAQREQLLRLLSPQNILNVVEMVDHRSEGSKERHIQLAITTPAEELIDSMFDVGSHLDIGPRGRSPPTLR